MTTFKINEYVFTKFKVLVTASLKTQSTILLKTCNEALYHLLLKKEQWYCFAFPHGHKRYWT